MPLECQDRETELIGNTLRKGQCAIGKQACNLQGKRKGKKARVTWKKEREFEEEKWGEELCRVRHSHKEQRTKMVEP